MRIAIMVGVGALVCACHSDGMEGRGDGGLSSTGSGGASSDTSDAGPLAAAAVTIHVTPTGGKECPGAGNILSAPSDESAAVYADLVGCKLSAGCQPDQYVVVDRLNGATVACDVASNASGGYNVLASVNAGPMSNRAGIAMRFDVSGVILPQGGTAAITETNSVYGGGGSDATCTVTITPDLGVIKAGAVWATFSCPMFRDQADIGDTQCLAEGAFLFENCAH